MAEQAVQLMKLVVQEVLDLQVEQGKQEDLAGQQSSLLHVHIQAPKLLVELYERQSARLHLQNATAHLSPKHLMNHT